MSFLIFRINTVWIFIFRLLIGAPRAQTRQPGVTRGGAVYRCPIDSGTYCQEIPFDTKGTVLVHWCIRPTYVGRGLRKHTFRHARPTKTQISLRIRAVWSESSLSAWRNCTSLAVQNATSEDYDQSARMRTDMKLRWVHIEGWSQDCSITCKYSWNPCLGASLTPL